MFLTARRHYPVTAKPSLALTGSRRLSVSIVSARQDQHRAVAFAGADRGMATSIVGMDFRYKAHLDEKPEVRKVKAQVSRKRS